MSGPRKEFKAACERTREATAALYRQLVVSFTADATRNGIGGYNAEAVAMRAYDHVYDGIMYHPTASLRIKNIALDALRREHFVD